MAWLWKGDPRPDSRVRASIWSRGFEPQNSGGRPKATTTNRSNWLNRTQRYGTTDNNPQDFNGLGAWPLDRLNPGSIPGGATHCDAVTNGPHVRS